MLAPESSQKFLSYITGPISDCADRDDGAADPI